MTVVFIIGCCQLSPEKQKKLVKNSAVCKNWLLQEHFNVGLLFYVSLQLIFVDFLS
jgi:hypothetical protein